MTHLRTLLLFCFLLTLALPLHAQDDDPDVLAQARQMYADAQYADVIALLTRDGVSSPAGLMLLASAQWMLGDYDSVVANCTRALDADVPRDAVARCYALRAAANAYRYGSYNAQVQSDLDALDDAAGKDSYPLLRGVIAWMTGDVTRVNRMLLAWANAVNSGYTDAGTLVPGPGISVELGVERVYAFTLDGVRDEWLTITVYGGTDIVLVLLDADGDPVTSVYSLGGYTSGIYSYVLPADGSYTLLVTHGEDDTPYDVTVTRVEMAAQDYAARADSAFYDDDYAAAARDYQRAVDLGMDDAYVYDRLGFCYYMVNQHDLAVLAYNRAIQLVPDFYWYYMGRAVSYAELGNYDAALADLDRAAQLGAGADLYLPRGIVYALAGRMVEAATDFYAWITSNETQRVAGSLTTGNAVTVPMTYGGVYAVPFDARAGQVFIFTAQALPADARVDPLLVILDPDGNPITGDDDGMNGGANQNSRITFTAPADGTYTLIISHAGGGSEGDVRVQMDVAQ